MHHQNAKIRSTKGNYRLKKKKTSYRGRYQKGKKHSKNAMYYIRKRVLDEIEVKKASN